MKTVVKLLLLVLLCVFCVFGSLKVSSLLIYSHQPEVSEVTTPLPTEVIQDLCEKLRLATDDSRCQPGAIAYSPDFADAVKAQFEIGISNYPEVQAVLGEYLYNQEARVVLADGSTYFRCWYDLRGDHIFPLIIRFSGPQDIVSSITQRRFDSP